MQIILPVILAAALGFTVAGLDHGAAGGVILDAAQGLDAISTTAPAQR